MSIVKRNRTLNSNKPPIKKEATSVSTKIDYGTYLGKGEELDVELSGTNEWLPDRKHHQLSGTSYEKLYQH